MWSRLVILFLLALIVGVPVALSPKPLADVAAHDHPRLVVLTPHNEQIRHEFSRAFNRWRVRTGKPPIVFDWRTSGGTADLRKLVFDQFEAKIRHGQEDEGIDCDLFFGGGDYEHGLLAKGIRTQRNGQELRIALSMPANFPEGVFEKAFPQPRIGSEQLYHQELRWIGVALSSFGIIYNRDVLDILGLEEPRRWSDLIDGRYMRWVALADPAHSGSIAATYNAILRRHGWNEGWNVLRRVFANARYFTSSAGKVPVDVSAGEAAAGMCIDFYGRFQAGAIGDDRVGYVDPKHMTAITADPISILRGAPDHALANEFVVWLLSPTAQNLWQHRSGTPDGPERDPLRRLPIRKDLYHDAQMQKWVDKVNPFDIAKPFADGMPNFYRAVAPVAHALAIDVHADLRAAWQAILVQHDPQKKERMISEFVTMPDELKVQWIIATCTTSRDHGLSTGDTVNVSGSAHSYLNRADVRITVPAQSTTVFTYPLAAGLPAVHTDTDALTVQPTGQNRTLAVTGITVAVDPEVTRSWKRILEEKNHHRHGEVVQVLDEFAGSLQLRMSDPQRFLEDRLRWTKFFRKQYHLVLQIAQN